MNRYIKYLQTTKKNIFIRNNEKCIYGNYFGVSRWIENELPNSVDISVNLNKMNSDYDIIKLNSWLTYIKNKKYTKTLAQPVVPKITVNISNPDINYLKKIKYVDNNILNLHKIPLNQARNLVCFKFSQTLINRMVLVDDFVVTKHNYNENNIIKMLFFLDNKHLSKEKYDFITSLNCSINIPLYFNKFTFHDFDSPINDLTLKFNYHRKYVKYCKTFPEIMKYLLNFNSLLNKYYGKIDVQKYYGFYKIEIYTDCPNRELIEELKKMFASFPVSFTIHYI